MKLFIADFCNCLDLPHFETFFYKNISDGNISLYKDSLTSFEQFDQIYTWLLEEINRNPFSISKGLILLFIPRNLTQSLSYYDIDNTAKIYVRELISSKLDSRFSYVCVFVDQTGKDLTQDNSYIKIKEICSKYASDEPNISKGMFSDTELSATHSVDELQNLIANIQDKTVSNFFSKVLTNELNFSDADSVDFDTVIKKSFFQNCSKEIMLTKSMTVSYFGSDISKKIETLLKLISYVCDFADKVNDEHYSVSLDSFLNTDEYQKYTPDYDKIRKTIVVYEERLKNWLLSADDDIENSDTISDNTSYSETHEASGFKQEVEGIITTDFIQDIIKSSWKDLDKFDISKDVFEKLDKELEKINKKLYEFCDKRVKSIYDFRKDNGDYITEEASSVEYTSDETEELAEAIDAINQYSSNELPGYSAELKLRQELDIISAKVQYVGKRIKTARPKLFIGTLSFAILSVLLYYFFTQYSILVNENTWWVFGGYIALCLISFIPSYYVLMAYYRRRVYRLLNECREKINIFLDNYKKRAEEFENNINNAMRYACTQGKQYKLSKQRHNRIWENERFCWHKLRIKTILNNLKYFDGFTSSVQNKEKETNIPKLCYNDKLYYHDDKHCEFYQMRIF